MQSFPTHLQQKPWQMYSCVLPFVLSQLLHTYFQGVILYATLRGCFSVGHTLIDVGFSFTGIVLISGII